MFKQTTNTQILTHKIMKRIKLVSALLVACLFVACSPSTRITGSWVDPAASTNFTSGQTVFIASLTRNIEVRTKMETELEAYVKTRNINVVKGNTYFTPDFYQTIPTEKQMLRIIRKSGANTILMVSMTNKKSKNINYNGGGGFYPFGFYNWWGPSFYGQNYQYRESVYYMESNLYDLKTNKIIWSAQSETINPGSISKFVKTYPKVLIDQMIKDGVLKG